MKVFLMFYFFFSSRRRHTRLQGDWSSDVCSSDLLKALAGYYAAEKLKTRESVVEGLANAPQGLIALLKGGRSEEHTSELQSPCDLVCRLLLELKNDDDKPQDGRIGATKAGEVDRE